jgi:phage N-6-adenine-methyltransferase
MILSIRVKRNKQRLLPVPSSAEVLLKELIKDKKDDEYLFVGRNQTNKPLSVSSFNASLLVKARKARIKKQISSHTFRRSLLTKLILKGYNLDKIKEGVSFHSDISTLFIYKTSQEIELKDNPILDLEYGSSPERDDWATPRSLITKLEKEFGKFDLDVCASDKNKVCERFFDKSTNGLEQVWDGSLVFCNPPYSQKNEFIEKAHKEAQKGTKIVLLMPSFTETKWFSAMKAKSDWLLFLSGRLVFNEHEQKETAKFSSVLAFFNIEPREIPDLGWSIKG